MSTRDISLQVASNEIAGLTATHLPRYARELKEKITGDVRFQKHDRMLYATDASLYQVEPIAVVIPADIPDVITTVKYCYDNKLPILSRGGGTSLAGQCTNKAVVIDFSVNCNRLLEVDKANHCCRVEPGIVLDHLNNNLKNNCNTSDSELLWFAPDVATASHANIGGMIGNNSAGAHSIIYGQTVNHILELKVLLVNSEELNLYTGAANNKNDGIFNITHRVVETVKSVAEQIRNEFPKTKRKVNGYNLDIILSQIENSTAGTYDKVNLSHLICGSEGTLAVITEAKLKLVKRPKYTGLAIAGFNSLTQALNNLSAVINTSPSAVELLDDMIINLADTSTGFNKYTKILPPINNTLPQAALYIEYFADSPEQLINKLETLKLNIIPESNIVTYTNPGDMTSAWKLRKAGEPLLHTIPGLRKPITFVEDTAVDTDKLPAFVQDFKNIVKSYNTTAAFYAHASVGCLHIRPLLDIHNSVDRKSMIEIAEKVTDLVKSYNGALSGEHGDGRVRSPLLERFYSSDIINAFRKIKQIFDPDNLLNPGNIVNPEPMDTHLRVLPQPDSPVKTPEINSYFHYPNHENNYFNAVEECNGAGVCRKKSDGIMCPSYRATSDERHSTRGRANALRLTLSSQLTNTENIVYPIWNNHETLKTLELCLSCKACKNECPSNVDMAKYKAEYLAQSFLYNQHIPLKTRIFSNTDKLNRLGSRLAPFSNMLVKNKPVRYLLNKILHLAPPRSLPAFARSIHKIYPENQLKNINQDGPTVILYTDCFTSYCDTGVAKSTIQTLHAFGYRVQIPQIPCCARDAISQGNLATACKKAQTAAQTLINEIQNHQAIAVIVCEPGCLSAIHDEWQELKLNLNPQNLSNLKNLTCSPEQFLENNWQAHPQIPKFKNLNNLDKDTDTNNQSNTNIHSGNNIITLHTHCHQKTLWDNNSSAEIITRIFGSNCSINILDTGCCGMAGTFGYDADKYQISMAIAELSLLPAIRKLHQDKDSINNLSNIILATGTSCRHQILHLTEYQPLHPIQLIAKHLCL